MPTLPPAILTVLLPFSKLFFSSKTWGHAVLLLVGSLMCRGGRTVYSALKTLGMRGEKGFDKYHKLLNRAKWSSHLGSKILLQQLLGQEDETLIISVDEHLERRRGKNIRAKGYYRDAVRSTKKMCSQMLWSQMDYGDASKEVSLAFSALCASLHDSISTIFDSQ